MTAAQTQHISSIHVAGTDVVVPLPLKQPHNSDACFSALGLTIATLEGQ